MAKGASTNFLANIDQDSWFHRIDPRSKVYLILFFGTIPLLFTDPRIIFFFILLCLPLWLTSNLDFKPMIAPLIGASFMLIVIFVLNLIRLPGEVSIDANAEIAWSFMIGPLLITSHSITRSFFLAGRLLVPVTIGLLIISTTDPTYLAKGIKRMGVPTAFVFMVMSALRFIPIVMDQMTDILNALSIRGMSGSRFTKTRLLILPLFITSLRRTRTMGLASEAKGFGANLWNDFYEELVFKRNDKILLLALAFLTILSLVLRFGFGFGAGLYIPSGAR